MKPSTVIDYRIEVDASGLIVATVRRANYIAQSASMFSHVERPVKREYIPTGASIGRIARLLLMRDPFGLAEMEF